MSVRRALVAFAVAGAALAPAAHADYPYTCDNVNCFALWCVDHLGDCRDNSPSWRYCASWVACYNGTGDVTDYVAYCTLYNSPVDCVI